MNLKINDDAINLPEERSDAFNEYFINARPRLANLMQNPNFTFKQYTKPAASKMTRFKLLPVTKVAKLLSRFSSSKATGLDKISGRF